jgi:SAM-dependent methyltransferase
MLPKHKQFETEHASVFGDASVVEAYQYRPPYPAETYEILLALLDPNASVRAVLDAGCGPGIIARALVHAVDRVDAVDIAPRMLEAGKTLPGGNDPKLRWILGGVEDAPLQPPYALIVAAASLHWMHWETVMPRFAQVLTPGGVLATVEESTEPLPWSSQMGFFAEYSTNKDFKAYNMLTVTQELAERGLFEPGGEKMTKAVPFRQSIEDYIESFHARNGLSRERMGAQAASEFDERVRELVSRHCPNGFVKMQIRGRVIWGKPK